MVADITPRLIIQRRRIMPPPDQFPRTDLVNMMPTATVQVVFGYRDSALDYSFSRRLQMQDPLPEHFRQRAERSAEDLRDNRAGRAYDPEWPLTDEQFFYFDGCGTPPPGGNFFPRLANFNTLRWFGQGRRVGPKLYVVIAQLNDDSRGVLRLRITARNVLERRQDNPRALFNGEVFDEVDDTIVQLPRRLRLDRLAGHADCSRCGELPCDFP